MTDPSPAKPELAGPVIIGLIDAEIAVSRARTSSYQTRGLAVISSAGTMVTLLFGLSALATKAQDFAMPTTVVVPLCLAAAFLVLSAVAAIWTNAPRRVEGVTLTDLGAKLDADRWNRPAHRAQQAMAPAQLKVAESERKVSRNVAWTLLFAITLEIAGIACVAWAVLALILGA